MWGRTAGRYDGGGMGWGCTYYISIKRTTATSRRIGSIIGSVVGMGMGDVGGHFM